MLSAIASSLEGSIICFLGSDRTGEDERGFMVLPLPVNLWHMFNSLNPGPRHFGLVEIYHFWLIVAWLPSSKSLAKASQCCSSSTATCPSPDPFLIVRFTWSVTLPNSAYVHPTASHCSWAQVTFLQVPRKTWHWSLSTRSSSQAWGSAHSALWAPPLWSFFLPLRCPVPSFHRAVPTSFLLPGRRFPFFFLSYLLVILSSEATFLSRSHAKLSWPHVFFLSGNYSSCIFACV